MQSNIFEMLYKPLPKWEGKLKVGTFFSGIGAPEKALKNIGVDYELMFFSEIDKYAIQSYCAIHDTSIEKNLGDITKINGKDLPYCDLWFGGFPCQDISLAGKQKGWSENTRSSLGWEMIRLLDEVEKKPKFVIFENVANIMSESMRPTLNLFKQDLEERGYTLYNEILNAKDYTIPQNRDRYFLVAILGEYYYEFPKPIELKLRLKDMLEDNVDEKYYLSENAIKGMLETNYQQGKYENRVQNEICSTLCARDYKDPKCVEVLGTYQYSKSDNFMKGKNRFQQNKNTADTLQTTPKEGVVLKIPEATKKGYAEAYEGDGIYINRPHQKRGVVQKGMIQTLKTSGDDVGVIVKQYSDVSLDKIKNNIKDLEGCSNTITANPQRPTIDNATLINQNLRIRKLTPLECWRLMGFDDIDYARASEVCSNSQLYKQAGNSIVVQVLEGIFKNLLGVK